MQLVAFAFGSGGPGAGAMDVKLGKPYLSCLQTNREGFRWGKAHLFEQFKMAMRLNSRR